MVTALITLLFCFIVFIIYRTIINHIKTVTLLGLRICGWKVGDNVAVKGHRVFFFDRVGILSLLMLVRVEVALGHESLEKIETYLKYENLAEGAEKRALKSKLENWPMWKQ